MKIQPMNVDNLNCAVLSPTEARSDFFSPTTAGLSEEAQRPDVSAGDEFCSILGYLYRAAKAKLRPREREQFIRT